VSMRLLLLACTGGAIGAGLRYAIGHWFAERGLTQFPWATLIINVSGSMLMGIVAGTLIARTQVPPEVRIFLATGILGGYTTFSAFSLELWQLADRGALGAAAIYLAASVILSVAGLVAGLAAARWMLS
jgi:fluoride exporter